MTSDTGTSIPQSKKTAGRGEYDELQYGDDPAQRIPASKYLLNVMTGADHADRRTDIIMHNKEIEVTPKTSDSTPINTMQLVLDSVHLHTQLARQNSNGQVKPKLCANFSSSRCPYPFSTGASKKEYLFEATIRPSVTSLLHIQS